MYPLCPRMTPQHRLTRTKEACMFGVLRIARSSVRLDAAFREVSVRCVALHIRQYDATLPCDHKSRLTRGRVTFSLVSLQT